MTSRRPWNPETAPVRASPVGWTALLVGAVVALGLLSLLLFVVGVGDVLGALAAADRTALSAAAAAAVAWVAVWSLSLHLVLDALAIPTDLRESFLAYTTLLFANKVTPFSTLGGEPVAALLLSRRTGTPYERSFAAVASADLLNFAPAPPLAFLGLFYLGGTALLHTPLGTLFVPLLAVAALLLVVGYSLWRHRRRLVPAAVTVVATAERVTVRFLPGVRFPAPETVERRVSEAILALEWVAVDRRVLVVGATAATSGWVLLSATLWFALVAVGGVVPLVTPLFVVPLVTVTDVVPLPGGLGSVDAVLVLLLVTTAGIPAAEATAAALLYRVATFVLPVVIGGVTTASLLHR